MGISGIFLPAISGILMAVATASISTGTILTAQSYDMTIKQHISLVPYEAIMGGTMTIVAIVLYGSIL